MNKILKKILKKSLIYKPLKFIQTRISYLVMTKKAKLISKSGSLQLPSGIVFEPTVKCNLKCQMCYQKKERCLSGKDLSLENIKKIFLKLKKKYNIKNIAMIGAEVFMRNDIFNIINFFDELDIKVYLATNGTLINGSNINRLRSCKNISGIGYSLDGLKDLHNQIRGTDYAFDRLIDAIKLTKDHFNLTVNAVVMDDNIDQLVEIGKLVRSLGVNNFSLQFEMFVTKDEFEKTKSLLSLDDNDLSLEIKDKQNYSFSVTKISQIVDDLRKINGLNILIQPDVFNKYPKEYLDGTLLQNHKVFCKDFNSIRINARGDVILCPFIKKSFGNLLEQEIYDIWNSDDLKTTRMVLSKNNLSPICKRCCRLGKF